MKTEQLPDKKNQLNFKVLIPTIIFLKKNYVFIIKMINVFKDKLRFVLTQNQNVG